MRGNPEFPSGDSTTFPQKEWPHEEIRTRQFFHKGSIRAYEDLISEFCTNTFPFWTYRQIRHFLTSTPSTTTWTRKLTPFESLCSNNTPQRHLISHIYSILQDKTLAATTEIPRNTREKDLQMTLTDEDWESIYNVEHKGSMNVVIQENGYKIITKWYRTPSRLHKFSPTIPNIRWRC